MIHKTSPLLLERQATEYLREEEMTRRTGGVGAKAKYRKGCLSNWGNVSERAREKSSFFRVSITMPNSNTLADE